MFRSLVRLYLTVVIGATIAIFLCYLSLFRIFREPIQRAERESMSSYSFLLSDYLLRHQGSQRNAALDKLRARNDDALEVYSLSGNEPLTPNSLHDLRDGKMIVNADGTAWLIPIPDGTIVRMRRKPSTHVDTQIAGYGVIALITLLSVFIWVHRHWRDLRILEVAAKNFGKGRFSTRAQVRVHSSIYDLVHQFNEMAGQIETSIAHQRDLMNGISHELKTPLARLEFGLALLGTSDESKERLRQRALQRDVRELDEMVTELLTLSSFEQGKAYTAMIRVSVLELLDSIVGSIADDVASRNLEFVTTTHSAPAYHVCDPKLVARAVMNLIRNAARYARTTIALHAATGETGNLMLSVDDDGPGIPVAERLRVFEAFYRLDPSRHRHTGGFGLGLSLVRHVAVGHGGGVHIEDSELGGARFVISLPLVPRSDVT